jgi:hypothetical protein
MHLDYIDKDTPMLDAQGLDSRKSILGNIDPINDQPYKQPSQSYRLRAVCPKDGKAYDLSRCPTSNFKNAPENSHVPTSEKAEKTDRQEG